MRPRFSRSPEEAAELRFPRDYESGRAQFLEAAKIAKAPVRRYENPNKGPLGEDLSTDVALQGAAGAPSLLVTISATHGVEGFCGSAVQADWLCESVAAPLPDGVAVLHIHAINPHGFAWLRRVTEENVDLNRNFVDFARPLPENPEYDALADAFVPPSSAPELVAAGEARIKAFREKFGERALHRARSGGQYRHPRGIFFGGARPSWARRTLERIVDEFDLGGRARIAVVDLHTGLGPYGYGEAICDHDPGSPNIETARRWYGEAVTVPLLGNSASVPKHGTAGIDFWQRRFGARAVYVALEFGTFSPEHGRGPMREDHVLHGAGPVVWHAPETQRIKTALRRHFFPDTRPWREMVVFRSRQVLAQAVDGLAADRGSPVDGGGLRPR